MIKLPVHEKVDFEAEVAVVVGFAGEVEIQYTGIVSALKEESGTLHLEKSNGNFIEISKSYLYFEVVIGDEDD